MSSITIATVEVTDKHQGQSRSQINPSGSGKKQNTAGGIMDNML